MYRDDARQDDEKNYLELLESFNNNQNSNRNTKEKPNVYENTETNLPKPVITNESQNLVQKPASLREARANRRSRSNSREVRRKKSNVIINHTPSEKKQKDFEQGLEEEGEYYNNLHKQDR